MSKFKVIIPGYAYAKGENFYASPTTTVIWDSGKIILVDPGASPDLIDHLSNNEISPDDISLIYLTHYHPDHFLNLKYFPKLSVLDGSTFWENDKETEHGLDKIPDTDIRILQTPGHSGEHSSLLIETEDQGTVCIAQDVFWWEDGNQDTIDYDKLINYPDPFASDFEALKESRKKVLEIADFIIPGHGNGFINTFKTQK